MKNRLVVALIAAFAANGALSAGIGVAPASPSSQSSQAPQAESTLKGEVLEVIDVEAYTYMRLKTANGEVWAAVGKTPIKKGAVVAVQNPAVMTNFHSETLKRTFPTIVFGTVAIPGKASTAASGAPVAGAPPAQANLGQIHGSAAATTGVAVAKVAKAEGPTGRTISEVNAQRVALKDKPVAIRATVVKVNANVMGKNWVHLRDGSGSATDQSNDLIATSSEAPKVGEVVVAKGVVRTDVDLGSGYAYKVLVENVSFQRQK